MSLVSIERRKKNEFFQLWWWRMSSVLVECMLLRKLMRKVCEEFVVSIMKNESAKKGVATEYCRERIEVKEFVQQNQEVTNNNCLPKRMYV
jgi:hypothetical protein